jgi:hypothetical protein
MALDWLLVVATIFLIVFSYLELSFATNLAGGDTLG